MDKPVRLHTFDFSKGRVSQAGAAAVTPTSRESIYIEHLPKTGNVRRDIMTFRTVSNGPASEGKWIHPGTKRHKFLDRAEIWAMEEWETKILPEILDKYGR